MCSVLGVSKSGYFKWVDRPKSERQKQHEKLSQEILQTHLEYKQRYGSVKITKTLRKRGIKVSERTVSRIMTKNGWKSCTVKKYKATTNSKHHHPVSENVLDRQFKASKPNQLWVTDITYIPTKQGKKPRNLCLNTSSFSTMQKEFIPHWITILQTNLSVYTINPWRNTSTEVQ